MNCPAWPVKMYFEVAGLEPACRGEIERAIRRSGLWLYKDAFPVIKASPDEGMEGWGVLVQDFWVVSREYLVDHAQNIENAIVRANNGIRPKHLRVWAVSDRHFWDNI